MSYFSTWEPAGNLDCPELLLKFNQARVIPEGAALTISEGREWVQVPSDIRK